MRNISIVLPAKAIGTQSALSVTSSSTQILAANADRNYLLIQNNSDTDIFINLVGAAASVDVATVNTSFKLAASGGSLELKTWVAVGAIFGIHGGAGTKKLTCLEG
jgi:hypothetical protein